ncbi:hypothetical protein HDU76_010017, partial [Blyttiomyces sp. JEL0837]
MRPHDMYPEFNHFDLGQLRAALDARQQDLVRLTEELANASWAMDINNQSQLLRAPILPYVQYLELRPENVPSNYLWERELRLILPKCLTLRGVFGGPYAWHFYNETMAPLFKGVSPSLTHMDVVPPSLPTSSLPESAIDLLKKSYQHAVQWLHGVPTVNNVTTINLDLSRLLPAIFLQCAESKQTLAKLLNLQKIHVTMALQSYEAKDKTGLLAVGRRVLNLLPVTLHRLKVVMNMDILAHFHHQDLDQRPPQRLAKVETLELFFIPHDETLTEPYPTKVRDGLNALLCYWLDLNKVQRILLQTDTMTLVLSLQGVGDSETRTLAFAEAAAHVLFKYSDNNNPPNSPQIADFYQYVQHVELQDIEHAIVLTKAAKEDQVVAGVLRRLESLTMLPPSSVKDENSLVMIYGNQRDRQVENWYIRSLAALLELLEVCIGITHLTCVPYFANSDLIIKFGEKLSTHPTL